MADVADNFDRADGGLGPDWTAVYGAPFTITANAAQPNDGGESCAAYTASTFGADQFARITVGALSAGTWVGVAVRANPQDGSGYIFYVDSSSSYLFHTPSFDVLGTHDVVFVPGTVVELESVGQTLTARINGQNVLTATDSRLSSGQPGIAAFGSGASTIASWTAEDVGDTPPPVELATGSGAAQAGPATSAGTATSTPPSATATGSATATLATATGTATATAPTATGSGSAQGSHATGSGTATATAPVATGNGAGSAGGANASGQAASTPPMTTGSGSAQVSPATGIGMATATIPATSAAGVAGADSATASGTATSTPPTATATGSPQAGAATVSGYGNTGTLPARPAGRHIRLLPERRAMRLAQETRYQCLALETRHGALAENEVGVVQFLDVKSVDDTTWWSIDLAPALAGATVTSATATVDGATLTILDQRRTGTVLYVLLDGGVPGDHLLRVQIATTDLQDIVRYVRLAVEERL